MNMVAINTIERTVSIQPSFNKVDVVVIRIHTDYEFLWYNQTTPEHTEV